MMCELIHKNGVDAEKFEKIYGMLIEEVKAALPETKIMVFGPFCLPGTATDNTEEMPDKWACFRSEVEKRAGKVKAVAEKYGLIFIPLQELFEKATDTAEPAYWLFDGVHPTAAGHELIKREWLKCFVHLGWYRKREKQ